MRRFVIGISGVTCGGKTTLIQFLRVKFPGCQVLYQDKYLNDEKDPCHIRLPEAGNHINYEIYTALDMNRMHQDIFKILEAEENAGEISSKLCGFSDSDSPDNAPNFEEFELKENGTDIDMNKHTSAGYKDVLILLLEGYLIFGSEIIYDICDVRFFLTLDKKECYRRRLERTCYAINYCKIPGYFEHGIWKEYVSHYENCISNREGIHILNGNIKIADIRKKAFGIISDAMDYKLK